MGRIGLVIMALLSTFAVGSRASDFAVGVSPPHFELRGQPGAVVRDVLLLLNTADGFGEYQVRSADWSMDPLGGVTIHGPELVDGSCRPWVKIERKKVQLEPLGRRNYRFEVHVPADAPAGECRFALLISQAPSELSGNAAEQGRSSIRMPIAAQIAVIVYVAIADAGPELLFVGAGVADRGKGLLPTVTLSNQGSAHGRPFGNLVGVDAAGNQHEFIVTPVPVLSGHTVEVPLTYDPTLPVEQIKPLLLPVELRGDIEFEQGSVHIQANVGN